MNRRLMEGTLDLGFAFEPPQRPQIEAIEIALIPLILVSSKRGQSIEQALADDYIQVDWGPAFSITHSRHFAELPTPAVRLPLGRIAQRYLYDCGGSAYLAEPAVNSALTQGRLFRVEGAPVIERPAYALRALTNSATPMLDTALSLFRNNSTSLPG